MDCNFSFRRNQRGNYIGYIDGKRCTVFIGKYGRWSFFLDDEPAGKWFDTHGAAIHGAIEKAMPISACFRFFGLEPPITQESLTARYRQLAVKTHPDRGGTAAAFKEVQANFEAAMARLGGAA